MITKKEILPIHKYFSEQVKYNHRNSKWTKKEAQYILDLITRDWKMEGKMRKPYQIRNEMEHQKKLANQENSDSGWLAEKYWTRVHFASWVLGDSSTF